jgi:RNA polymerase sigma-70 factor (ECF subfamily)
MARPVIHELRLGPMSAAEAEERRRVLQLQEGSEEAFQQLIADYSPTVYRLAYRLLNDPADASDVAQEVFLKVFRCIGQFHCDCSLKTWIYHITVNTVWNQNRWWRRHRGPECALEGDQGETAVEARALTTEDASPLQAVLSHEMQEIVQKALLRLDESQRLVLVLREMEDLSYEEVADVLQVSLGTVKSRLARARQALKRELKQMVEPAAGTVPAWNTAE